MSRFLTAALVCGSLSYPTGAAAWGFDAHKAIAEQFIALLPPELKPYFESHKATIIERSVDPDIWRTVGWTAEAPHHFIDLDYYGKFPFPELPHELDRAVQKYGREVVDEQGTLPWRTQEFYGELQRTFAELKSGRPVGYGLDNIAVYAAILAHYVSDGHVPLHAVINYDGQLTNQLGVHSRWESELFERNRKAIKVAPAPPLPISDPREFMFGTLLDSFQLAESVLQSDRKAGQGREFYDDGYFEAFGNAQLSVLEKRFNDSITAVASLVIGAWHQAGRPAIPVQRSRQPRPIRKPGGKPPGGN